MSTAAKTKHAPAMNAEALAPEIVVAKDNDGGKTEAFIVGDQAKHDAGILALVLARLSRLMGGPNHGEPVADIDTAGVSERYVDLVNWGKVARLP